MYSTILLPELPSSAVLESRPERNHVHAEHKQHRLRSASVRMLNVKNADYVLTSLLCFWAWEHRSCIAVYAGSGSSRISSKISYSVDERRSYRFGTTWGGVINDRICIFGWVNPLIMESVVQWRTLKSMELFFKYSSHNVLLRTVYRKVLCNVNNVLCGSLLSHESTKHADIQ